MLQSLAQLILEEGRKQNLFSTSITVTDVERVLEKCLIKDDNEILALAPSSLSEM